MADDGWRKPRTRWGLLGMMATVAVVAPLMLVLRPHLGLRLRLLERYVFVQTHQGELRRHADAAVLHRLAEDFAGAIRSGRPEAALELTTAAFRGRTTADDLRTLAAGAGLDLGPCELIGATCSLPEGTNHFISELTLRCGPEAGPGRTARLIVVSERGSLRVERIAAGSK